MENNNEIDTQKKTFGKKHVIVYIVLLIIILAGVFYVLYSKGIIFDKKGKSTPSNSSTKKSDSKSSNEAGGNTKTKDINNDIVVDKDTSKYDLTVHSVCEEMDNSTGYREKCTINGYEFRIKYGSKREIYNKDDKLLVSFDCDIINGYTCERYGFNSDGSVSVLGTCDQEVYHLGCGYKRYSYDGELLNKNSSTKVSKVFDNYIIAIDDFVLKLLDFKENHIDAFDVNVSDYTYGSIYECSGWLVLKGEDKGIFFGSETKDANDYKEIYYIYDPKTKKVTTQTREPHEQYSCSLVVDNY